MLKKCLSAAAPLPQKHRRKGRRARYALAEMNCPECGRVMARRKQKSQIIYDCENPRCPVISMRIFHGIKHVAREPSFNEDTNSRDAKKA